MITSAKALDDATQIGRLAESELESLRQTHFDDIYNSTSYTWFKPICDGMAKFLARAQPLYHEKDSYDSLVELIVDLVRLNTSLLPVSRYDLEAQPFISRGVSRIRELIVAQSPADFLKHQVTTTVRTQYILTVH